MVPQRTDRSHSCHDVSYPSTPLITSFQSHHKGSIFGDDDILDSLDEHAEGKMAPIALELHYSLPGIVLFQKLLSGNLEMLLEESQLSKVG
jgi:hypothetical protein